MQKSSGGLKISFELLLTDDLQGGWEQIGFVIDIR
jgi:hypothetical protein